MSELLPFIIVGLVTGSLYGLAGVGLVLTFRTSGVFNLAHGAIAAAAAFLFYELHITHGIPWPIALVGTVMAFAAVGGVALELLTRRLVHAPEALGVVLTVGGILGIQGFLNVQFGAVARAFPAFLPESGFEISGVNVSWGQVISAVVALVGALGLYLYMRVSRLGVFMRAVVDDPNLVSLAGERPLSVRRSAWAIGSGFAALSGVLLAPTIGLDSNLLTFLVVQAFGACAIGMFASLPMTYLGGIGVGLAASIATKYLDEPPLTGIPAAVPFLILIAVLMVVPVKRLPRARAAARSLLPDTKPFTARTTATVAIVGLIGLLIVPHVVGTKLPVWTAGLISVVIFASLALLVWTSGQISLCHASFVALGATSMAKLLDAGLPWGVALLLAGLATVPVGAIVAIPALRLSGIYLALVTLGFGILMQNVIYPSFLMFGATQTAAATRPDLGPISTSDTSFFYVALAVAVLCCAFVVILLKSQLGRLLQALAESPTLLTTGGLGVTTTRLLVFCASAFLAGIAGGLTVTQYSAVSGVTYGPVTSLVLLAVLAIGGTRPLRSAVIAATLYSVLPGYVASFDIDRQTFGFGFVAIAAALIIANRPNIERWMDRSASETDDRRGRGPTRVARRTEGPAAILEEVGA